MKTLKLVLTMATAVTLLGIANVPAAELQSVSVQYGQGSPVTFFKPSAQNTTGEYGNAAKQGKTTVWKQQSIPNGSAISYDVRANPHFEVAPLK